jgi:hypothetical protein
MRVEHWVEHFPRRLLVKRGVYYYVRRVPKALQARFQRVRVVLCLHTMRLEAMGFGLASNPIIAVAIGISQQPVQPILRLSDAHQIYGGYFLNILSKVKSSILNMISITAVR